MSKAPKGKRLYLINRDFQLRYTKVALLVGLASTVLSVTVILFPLFYLHILRFPNFVPLPFILAMVLAAGLNFFIVASLGIVVTHRIAGPMYSLVRYLHEARQGRAQRPLKVRETDDLKYLVRNVNEFFDHLAARTEADRQRVAALAKALAGSGGPDVAQALALAREFEADLERRLGRNGGDSGSTEIA